MHDSQAIKLPASSARALVATLLMFLAGCTTTVHCPVEPDNPRPIFLLDHGRHASLLLTDDQGTLRRYGYGDWRYYAKGETGTWNGMRAMLWPTPAALARQIYEGVEPTEANVINAVRVPIQEPHRFDVSGNAVDALIQALDEMFYQGAEEQNLVNPRVDFEFVPHRQDYWFWFSSNHMVVDWLEALECETRGFTGLAMTYRDGSK